MPVKLWLDDVEVKFLDQSSGQPMTDGAAFKPVVRDHFNKYATALFPDKGGWRNLTEKAERDKETLTDEGRGETRVQGRLATAHAPADKSDGSMIDETESVSPTKSFRLEKQETGPTNVSKRISLPARIPFVVSADIFSIVPFETQVQASGQGIERPDREREASRDKGKRGKENPGSSGREGSASGTSPSPGTRKPNSKAGTNRSSNARNATKTFSASPAGGSYYIYSFDGRLLAEYNLYGQCVRDYIYFGGQLIAEYDAIGSQLYYYTSDQINSTRIVTNSVGVVVCAPAYDPFGGIQTPQTWPNTFNPTPKFSGKERDGESDLDYFGARYYDESQYRFISVDFTTNPSLAMNDNRRWNLFAYCGDNPVTYADPDGNCYLIFCKNLKRLYIYDGNGKLVGVFPAANNVETGYSHFPNGIWYHDNNWNNNPNPGTDQYGFFGFPVPGHPDFGIHSGRVGETDGYGKSGWEYCTHGCIRTTQEAMFMLLYLECVEGDPVEFIWVTNEDVDQSTAARLANLSPQERQKLREAYERFIEGYKAIINLLTDYFFNSESPIPPGADI